MSYSTITHALVNYVESHLENMNLKEMAKSFGFSETYLRELFCRNLNMPIMQYCKRRRMIVSAFELLHSDKTILTIALENGFSTPESYTRAFKKIFGMTPSRFRSERPMMGRKQLEAGVYGSNTMFPICVKAVSEYLGDDVSYAYIIISFRMTRNLPLPLT